MPSSVYAGGVIDQFPQKRALWTRLPCHGCAFSFGTLGIGFADRLRDRRPPKSARSISTHDVVAADPIPLAILVHPMAWFPDVIPVSRPISGAAIVWPIPDGDYDRASSAVIWPGAIIRPGAGVRTVAGITSVIICAACDAERSANCNKQRHGSNFDVHQY